MDPQNGFLYTYTLPMRSMALVGVTIVILLMGCSGSGRESGTSKNAAPAVPSDDLTDREAIGEVAAVELPADSHPFCGRLVNTPALTGLGDGLTRDNADRGEPARAAADALAALEPPDDLDRDVFTEAANALRRYADGGGEGAQVDKAAAALDRLGEEVQELCDFPVG